MGRQTRRALGIFTLIVAWALLTICEHASAQAESTEPPLAETKVQVPEPKGRGVISISSRGDGPVTVRQNGKTRVYKSTQRSAVSQGRTQNTATRKSQYKSPRDVRWRELLRLLESGKVPIHARLSVEEMPNPPEARGRTASSRANSRTGTGSGSVTISRPRSN